MLNHTADTGLVSVALSPVARTSALARMAQEELDVLIVGGGVVGAGAALDAAARGLKVGIVEMRDWASGTSSRSSKLIHGGLRYLEMLDFGLVREALTERGLLLETLAPHLVKPVSFLYPLKHHAWERAYVGAGVALYDVMSTTRRNGRGLPMHRHLTRSRALKLAPALKRESFVGSLLYWDGQVDDARHTMELVRTAAQLGALAVNRARVTEFITRGDRVTGATIVDELTGVEIDVYAKEVINATGVWTEETQALLGAKDLTVKASKGIHIVVPRDRVNSNTGLILRTEKSVLFVIPWGRHWIIGTTDNEWIYDKAEPAATAEEIDYLLERVNSVLERPLSRADIEGIYAGLRPLISGNSSSTAKLSREHIVLRQAPGMTVIAGGKYTTYRVMAKDAVDEAVKGLGGSVPASTTENIPCLGAEGYRAMWLRRKDLADQYRLPVRTIEHLLNRYGSLTSEVLELMDTDVDLRDMLPGTSDYLAVEALYAVTHEGALHLEDILDRRTRLSIETWDRGIAAAEYTARLVASHLGWTDADVAREIEIFSKRVTAENAAAQEYDAARADELVRSAPRF